MIFRQAHFRDKLAPAGVGAAIFKRGIVQAVDQNGVFNFHSFIKPFKGHTNALETTPLTKILDFLLWCSSLWRDRPGLSLSQGNQGIHIDTENNIYYI